MIRSLFIAIAVLSGGPVLALSPDQDRAPSARVSYADLNLGSAAGRATLEQRVARAIREVCPDSAMADLAQTVNMMRCRQAARRSAAIQIARAEVGGSEVTQLALAGR